MNLIVALHPEVEYVPGHYSMRLPAQALAFSLGRGMLGVMGLRLPPNRGKSMNLIGVVNLDLNYVLSQYFVLVLQPPAISEGRGTLESMGLRNPEEFRLSEMDLTGSLLHKEGVPGVPVKLMG